MSALVIACVAVCALTAAAVAAGPWARRSFERLRGPSAGGSRDHLPDPGRELRAERRAEQLLRSVLGEEAFEAYKALGFLHVYGEPGEDGIPVYGYLIYPHKPIVSFDVASGELLNEHCVAFPDRSEPENAQRLPDADDVLAKWMALRGDERGLIRAANMNLPGRQLDPDHVRRDLVRLSEWTGRSPAGAGI
ncbi:MAG: hypothetical protein KDB58_06425 [Solirubrobacterales bacterium]|nr:hypothetical protein [Solirubrobacterales bacterium]